MGVVQTSQGNLEPVSSEMKSEVTIVANLAKAVFKDKHGLWETMDWDNLTGNYDEIRNLIAYVVAGLRTTTSESATQEGFICQSPSGTVEHFPPQSERPNSPFIPYLKSHSNRNPYQKRAT